MKALLVIGFCVLFAGCTGVTQYEHSPTEEDGLIHIYRNSAFNAGGVGAVIYIDDQNIVKLGTEEYTIIPISPGVHKLSTKGDQTAKLDERSVTISPKEHYYFEIIPNPDRLGPTLLIPLIDILSIKTFLIGDSNKSSYESVANGFQEEKVEFANKGLQVNR